MNHEDMIIKVKEQMPAKRWNHTLGVMETAEKLALRYGADVNKAVIAATLHDMCKHWPIDLQEEAIRESGEWLDVLEYDKQLWHAHAGAYVAARDCGVTDEEVLESIRFHTSGREQMTLLDKVVCLADYIEPGRDFPGVVEMRQLAEKSLEEALVAGFDGTIKFLIERGQIIYPLTVLTRNDLIRDIKAK
jgi:predicted HD superfamily hydrolase involved in NAD metabolism